MRALTLLAVALVLCAACPIATAATDEEIQAAIDSGLAWLASQQDPATGAFGTNRAVAKTGLAVKKFEHDAILRGYESPFDPEYMYHEVVEKGFDYIFQYAVIVPITAQPAGDPDTDGDGIGVAFVDPGTTYETGIALMAIAESTEPDRLVGDGSAVSGWTYRDVAIDVMNWLAWIQVDAPHAARGGWRYGAGYTTADQSNSGYATLGLAFFEAAPPSGFGLPVAPFVKSEMGDPGFWVDWIQNDVGVGDPQYDGGSGYSNPDPPVNILETGNLLFEMAWYGDGVATQRVQDAIDYIVRAWNLPGVPIGGDWTQYQGWRGCYQAMFTMMKGLEAFQIDMIDSIDWFDEVSTYIVTNQNGDGSWGPCFWDHYVGNDYILATSWALLTLQKVTIPPQYMLDIKPTSCPNPINVKSKGVLPVAVLGGDNADVMEIDPASIELEGVPPIRWAYADVATPVPPDAGECECTTEGPDGYLDLTLKFENELIVAAIEPVSDGEVRMLTLTGQTMDGLGFEAYDCVRVLDKRKGFEFVLAGEIDPPGKGQAITEVSLGGGHPNPFRSEVSVAYSLPSECRVSLTIYHVSGKRVATLVDDVVPAGHHSALWDGRDETGAPVATGVYFCRMTADGFQTSTKLVRIE
jgi:hypothetical protein